MKKNTASTSVWQKISLWIFFGLLAYMPLHIFLSTWLGTSFGILETTRVAKEGFLLVGAGIALALGLQKGIVRTLLRDRLMQLILVFVVLNVILALWRNTDLDAELLGLAYNVRFLIYFVWAVILGKLYFPKDILKVAIRIVLVVGEVTVAFGIFQYLLLPNDTLAHLGYARPNGVLPAFFIDDKPNLERVMSTIRDPNSFGSYLLIILGLVSVKFLAVVDRRKKLYYLAFVVTTLLALLLTFSRGAWIGALGTLGVVVIYFFARHKRRFIRYQTPMIFGALTLVVVGALGLFVFKDTYLVKNVVIHADESTVLEDPNELRLRFWRESVSDIANNPLGGGPGTAGLASIRNDEKTVLNENYYFQMAQETGVIGLLIFLAIIFILAKRLYLRLKMRDPVAIALLAAFVGLIITNFFAHLWANEAVAYTWWGLAGLAVAIPAKKSSKSA